MTAVIKPKTRYFDRELSWLDFNKRVLATADRNDIPILERLKFVAIAASNMDEFYMVRVAARLRDIRQQKQDSALFAPRSSDQELLRHITQKTKELVELSTVTLNEKIMPLLVEAGLKFCRTSELNTTQREKLAHYYMREVHPILTPIAIDTAHPLPRLRNLSRSLALRIIPATKAYTQRRKKKRVSSETSDQELFALVQVPSAIQPFYVIKTDESKHLFVSLDDVISSFVSKLFPGHEILESHPFRITRASDYDLIDHESENFIVSMQDILRKRERGEAIRLEISQAMSPKLRELLRRKLDLGPDSIHEYPDLLITKELMSLMKVDRPDLKFKPHSPMIRQNLRLEQNMFRQIQEKDILLYHPYESFNHIVEFMEQAADDPDVVAIKQTFYRTSGDSPLVSALRRAAANGKQVTALVELKARFDEANNIQWAQELEQDGVHVVYGLMGLKTHAKLALIIRREGTKLARYLHLGTGNYNSATARLYTDLSLMTADENITADAMQLFNVLTGYADLPVLHHLLVAPFNLREKLEEKIWRECNHVSDGKSGHIILKINSLADRDIIEVLYKASQAGVRIELIVRGICCLKPGIPGLSENITVRSTIDRFLEHARVFWFANAGEEELYLSSADWMPRNLNRRIEIAWPILEPRLKNRIREEILKNELNDNVSGWTLDSSGEYKAVTRSKKNAPLRVQSLLIRQAEQQHARYKSGIKQELLTGHLSRLPRRRDS